MKRLLALCLVLGVANYGHAATNLLTNGDFELDTPTFFYYDNAGGNTGTATDVPGWEAFGVGDSSSWVQVSEDNSLPGDWILNLSGSDVNGPGFVGLSGMKTAVGSRPAVTPGTGYNATVTFDNYFTSAGISYFIDWFNAGGALLSSSGGALPDPNGPLVFAPHTQLLQISGVAPGSAAAAGVRFLSANGAFAGASADNFTLSAVPEPASIALMIGLGGFLAARRRGR